MKQDNERRFRDKIDETVESKEMFKLKAMVLVAGKKNQEKQARLPHSPLENISVFYSLIAISFCSMSCHVGEDCSFRLIPWRCMHAQVSQPVCMLVVYPVVRACRHPAQRSGQLESVDFVAELDVRMHRLGHHLILLDRLLDRYKE
jgi:hypothetical protein